MANYFESGFTMLKELAAEKQKEKQLKKKSNAEKNFINECAKDKSCTHRFIDAMADCD
jgi:hypothetical protein